jgi:hypothetical protein
VKKHGSIEIMATRSTPLGNQLLAQIFMAPDGGIVATAHGSRIVLQLAPPSDDENRFGLIERVALACQAVDEF